MRCCSLLKGEENNLCALNFRVVLIALVHRNNISSFRMVKMLPAVEHENYTEVFMRVPRSWLTSNTCLINESFEYRGFLETCFQA